MTPKNSQCLRSKPMSKFSNSLAALTPKRRDQVEAVPHAQDAMRAYQSAQEARRKLTVEGEEREKKRQAKERDLDDAALKRAEAAHEKLFEEHQKILRA